MEAVAKSLLIPFSFSPFKLHSRTKLSANPAAMREVSWENVQHGELKNLSVRRDDRLVPSKPFWDVMEGVSTYTRQGAGFEQVDLRHVGIDIVENKLIGIESKNSLQLGVELAHPERYKLEKTAAIVWDAVWVDRKWTFSGGASY